MKFLFNFDYNEMDALAYCFQYPIRKKIYESSGDPMPLSVIIIGDPNHPENVRKREWFDKMCEYDKNRRKWLGWDN